MVRAVKTVDQLVTAIRLYRPEEEIAVDFIREGKRSQVLAQLQGRNVPGVKMNSEQMRKQFGAIPSKRAREFPLVLQHDTPLLPEQCGGPVVDIDGNVVGMNIARGGRVETYAIPARHVRTLVNELMRPAVAARDSETKDR